MEPDPKKLPKPGNPPKLRAKTRTFSLTGCYDLTATSGPPYTTKREEAAGQMIELLRAIPQSAPLIGDIIGVATDHPVAQLEFTNQLWPRLRIGVPLKHLESAVPNKDEEPCSILKAIHFGSNVSENVAGRHHTPHICGTEKRQKKPTPVYSRGARLLTSARRRSAARKGWSPASIFLSNALSNLSRPSMPQSL